MRTQRSGGVAPPLLFFSLVALSLTGCGPQSFSKSYPNVTSLEPPVPVDVQDQTRKSSEQFVADIQSGHYPEACLLMSPSLRKQLTPAGLENRMQGLYRPYIGAKQWQFDLFTSLSHGKQVVVHAHFTGSDNSSYRTNFAFTQQGRPWLIDMIVAPSKGTAPLIGNAKSSQAPGR